MNPTEALEWLYGTQKFGIKLGLKNMHRLMAELGVEQPAPRIVHVAGTNGKGSVCAFVDSVARSAGVVTGLFTSPHLLRFSERIRVNGEEIVAARLAEGLSALHDRVSEWEVPPTFFELTTALALWYFVRERVELAILETGMGGRLDATNAVNASVSVITEIALDHQKWLGNGLVDIAREKAGIIKPGVPVITGVQAPEVMAVFKEVAAACGAPLVVVDAAAGDQLPALGLGGVYQRHNAALAVEALRQLDLSLEREVLRRGLREVRWPARFEEVRPRWILDGAHNPAAAKALVESWKERWGEVGAQVFMGMLEGKNAREFLGALRPIVSAIHLAPFDAPRALSPADLADVAREAAVDAAAVVCHSTIGAALQALQGQSAPVLITGSLHFAGAVLGVLRSSEVEASAQ